MKKAIPYKEKIEKEGRKIRANRLKLSGLKKLLAPNILASIAVLASFGAYTGLCAHKRGVVENDRLIARYEAMDEEQKRLLSLHRIPSPYERSELDLMLDGFGYFVDDVIKKPWNKK